jgi:hypothetical protein
MENNKSLNQFQEVHKKVQERLDHIRETQEKDTALRNKKAIDEAFHEKNDHA